MHINLLPHSTRLLIQFDKQLRIYLKIWLGVAHCWILLDISIFLTHRAQRELAKIELVCEPVRETQQSIERYQRVVTNLRQRHNTLRLCKRLRKRLWLLVSWFKRSVTTWSCLCTAIDSPAGSKPVDGAQWGCRNAKEFCPSGQNIVIMGQAEDEAALTTLVKDLRQSGWMNRVELKSSSRSNHSSSRQFHIEAWRGLSSQPSPPELHQVY